MSDQANVQSFDAVQQVRVALAEFAKSAAEGLTELEMERRRVVDWVEHDRPAYWAKQEHLARDGVHEAKQALHRCLMFPVGVNERPSCSEERAALKKAEQHLQYCTRKRERQREWARELDHESHTYEGRTLQLKSAIEEDVPKAVAALGQILDRLEAYKNLASGKGSPSATGNSSASASDTEDDTPPSV